MFKWLNLLNCFICICKLLMCLYMCYCVGNGSLCNCIMYFWSFIHVSFVGTQCGFFPLCVANFSNLFTVLLLMHYSALCVLCVAFMLSILMTNVYINQLGAPLAFND